LEAHLGFWLRYVSNHVSSAFAAKLAERAVTAAEWVVMRDLYDRVTAIPSEVAERIGMTRGAISKLVDRLETKGLIVRTHDKNDRRFQTLALSATGRALVPKLAALADRNDAEFFDHLMPGERALLIGTMKEIVRRRALRTVPVD
jgi:DNA-binding MarR family transcriptional regulator